MPALVGPDGLRLKRPERQRADRDRTVAQTIVEPFARSKGDGQRSENRKHLAIIEAGEE